MAKNDDYTSGLAGFGSGQGWSQVGQLDREIRQKESRKQWDSWAATKVKKSDGSGGSISSGGSINGGGVLEGFFELSDWFGEPIESWYQNRFYGKKQFILLISVGVIFGLISLIFGAAYDAGSTIAYFLIGFCSVHISYISLRIVVSISTLAILAVLGLSIVCFAVIILGFILNYFGYT